MSEYSPDSADRSAFFAALAKVFQEHREASQGYAVCDVNRLATAAGVQLSGRVGVSRVEDGRLVTTFELFPGQTIDINDCVAVIPDFTTDPPSWDCIVYMSA